MRHLASLIALIPSLSLAQPPWCHRGEATVFACGTKESAAALCRVRKTNLLTFRAASLAEQSTKFFLSEMSASRWNERHVRFQVGQLSYVTYDRWNAKAPPAEGQERLIGIATFRPGYFPSDGEKAEFKRAYLVKKMRCSQFNWAEIEHWPGNLEHEGFIYGP